MAEFLHISPERVRIRADDERSLGSAFDAMGKPIPMFRRQAAYDDAKAMGLVSAEKRMACVGAMAEQLERDNPYEAMNAGMQFLDLTGTYRLMAVLLTAEEPAGE